MGIDAIKKNIVAGLEQTFPAKKGLEELVFGNAIEMTFDTEDVNFDIYDGTRGVAGYTARGAKGQTVGLEGWDTLNVRPPLIDENFVVSAQDLKVRGFGESGENNRGVQKFQTIVNRNITRLKDRKQRAYNAQIASLITSGKLTVAEKDDKGNTLASRDIDFSMPSTHIYTVGTAWNDTGADIFGDIEDAIELVAKDSGVTPDYALVGKATIADMLGNAKVKELIDNRRIEFGQFSKENKGNGLVYWGSFLGLDIYTFVDFDKDGNAYIPESAFVLGSSQAELDIVYGSIDALKNGVPTVVEGKEVITPSTDEEAVSAKFGFKSAKLYCLTQAGAFAHLTTR
jgi:hypothetical protein